MSYPTQPPAPGSNLPPLDRERFECLKFADDIARLGRNRVRRAAQFGVYLNNLFREHFAPGQPRAGEWTRTLEAWGLNPRTIEGYRLIAAELRPADSESDSESSMRAALAAARRARKERQAAEKEAEAARQDREARRLAQRATKTARIANEAAEELELAETAADAAQQELVDTRIDLDAERNATGAADNSHETRAQRHRDRALDDARSAERYANITAEQAARDSRKAKRAIEDRDRKQAAAEASRKRAEIAAAEGSPLVRRYREAIAFLRRHSWADIRDDARNGDDRTAAQAAHAEHRRWWTQARAAEEWNDDAQKQP